MVLTNVAPYNRTHVDHIQLVALGLERDNKIEFSKIFEVIIKDLRFLETEGIVIDNSPFQTVKGSLIAMVGDNLGSHQIGGYIENFATNQHFCRYCHIQKITLTVEEFVVLTIELKIRMIWMS